MTQEEFNEAVVDLLDEITCSLPDETPLFELQRQLDRLRAYYNTDES